MTGDVSSANMSPSAIADDDAPAAWDDRFGVDGAESAEAAPVAAAEIFSSESETEDRSDEDDARRRGARSSSADMASSIR